MAPARVLTPADGEVVGEVEGGAGATPVPRLSPMMATKAFRGDALATALYAGHCVDGVRRIEPAAAIVDELLELVH